MADVLTDYDLTPAEIHCDPARYELVTDAGGFVRDVTRLSNVPPPRDFLRVTTDATDDNPPDGYPDIPAGGVSTCRIMIQKVNGQTGADMVGAGDNDLIQIMTQAGKLSAVQVNLVNGYAEVVLTSATDTVITLVRAFDPGHGGEDPGAVHAATNLREADVALRIAHVLKAILDTHPEFEAALTREADRTVALKERTDLANARDAYLVSIHCNAAGDHRAHGTEVWCFAETGADGGESAGHRIARTIQEELVALGLRDRGVKVIYDRRSGEYVARRLWVLRKTRRPAVLVECAFISNPEEARLLGDELNGFKERLAAAVFRGLRASLLGERETKPAGKEVSV